MPNTALSDSELRDIISKGQSVIVAGTGVSIASSIDPATKKPHPQASWGGLLENGFEWLRKHTLIEDDIADAQLKLLKKNPQTHRFISAAEDITVDMGGSGSRHFADWLERTVGSIKAHDNKIVHALHAIRHGGNILATTNYDGLLLENQPALTPVTWQESAILIDAVRKQDTSKIIFLHGYWRKPESVILDWKSYEQIARDSQYRDDLAAFWKTKIWVYVGCGMNGLSDPDFGLLMDRYGERARSAGHWDYCLVLNNQKEEFQAYFDNHKLNIKAIPFGENHADLPEYLHSLLPAPVAATTPVAPAPARQQTYRGRVIPAPPVFYAEPDYIGSHTFVGREAQLQELNDWAKAADPTNLLLYEAIGGNGKSMLTWEWATKHAMAVRSDWAGRFWYSFYERGAVMADFCRRALAYMTGRPMEELEKKKTLELGDDLLACLHERPWLLILDGLERVLVAYHRIDAAEVPDEEANAPTDKILNRNPCDAIREEDSALLRRLAAATPSKILVSSRLTPRALLNLSGQPIPGAKRITLPGLRPADAEQLLRSCGITGNSEKIQEYLTQNCDNHPLVIGVLAGLIANYLPDRGNFDTWVADASPQGGAYLDLASLDLSQRRNHILRTAFETLPRTSRQLLSTLALISASVDYKTRSAFNPHLPPEPEKVEKPEPPENGWRWEFMDDKKKKEAQEHYETELATHRDYEESLKKWRGSKEFREAPGKLPETVKDLEQRGLLQFDGHSRRYDLHPVVRGVAAGGMKTEETNRCGQRVIDHFSALPHRPYEEVTTLDEVAPALQVVRTLLKLGRIQEAADAYRGELTLALFFNLEAHTETLSLLRPLFPSGWDKVPENLDTWSGSFLVHIVAMALNNVGEHETALTAYSASLKTFQEREEWQNASVTLSNIAVCLRNQNRLAMANRINILYHDLAVTLENKERLFRSLLSLFADQSRFGRWSETATTWQSLDPMGRNWPRSDYRQGSAEYWFAVNQFWQGKLQEVHLSTTEQLSRKDGNRQKLRAIWRLRGYWRLEQQEWALASESFHEALSMARERGLADAESETGLALAKLHLGQFHSPDEARHEAERLSGLRQLSRRYLAMLWREIGDLAQAEKHALAAYKWAWADGEPYVRRYELDKATELLKEMNIPIHNLRSYDPAKDEPFPWEADVRKAIEKLRAGKEAEKKKRKT